MPTPDTAGLQPETTISTSAFPAASVKQPFMIKWTLCQWTVLDFRWGGAQVRGVEPFPILSASVSVCVFSDGLFGQCRSPKQDQVQYQVTVPVLKRMQEVLKQLMLQGTVGCSKHEWLPLIHLQSWNCSSEHHNAFLWLWYYIRSS